METVYFTFVGGQSLNSLAVNFIRVHDWLSSYTVKVWAPIQ